MAPPRDRPLLVASHERSGTHFLMNALGLEFGYKTPQNASFHEPFVNVNFYHAATVAQAPIVTGATHTARAPIEAPSPTVTPTESQSDALFCVPSGLTARGKVSLVSTTAGPMKTPAASSAGS